MPRINLIAPETAEGTTKQMFEAVQKKLGLVPNMTRGLANSPAALNAYLQLSGALTASALSPKTRESLALTIGEINACGYCLSAHTLIGGKLGLAPTDVEGARRAESSDPKTAAILKLAKEIVLSRGEVKDADLRSARAAGVTDGEIAEIVATVALNVFTNYFNAVAGTPIDFPEVKPGHFATTAVDGSCATGACKS